MKSELSLSKSVWARFSQGAGRTVFTLMAVTALLATRSETRGCATAPAYPDLSAMRTPL